MWSTVPSAANAAGKAVNSITTTRISQTWFASQIGAICSAISARCASRPGPRASRSHTPPPKSAPPVSA